MKAVKIILIILVFLAIAAAIFFQTRPGKSMILQYKSYKATKELFDGEDLEKKNEESIERSIEESMEESLED